jgi:hypothetical protein
LYKRLNNFNAALILVNKNRPKPNDLRQIYLFPDKVRQATGKNSRRFFSANWPLLGENIVAMEKKLE